MKQSAYFAIAGIFLIAILSGCASRGYVDDQLTGPLTTEISAIRDELDAVKKNVEVNRETLSDLSSRIENELSRDAMSRADKDNKLAKGKLLYEVIMSDESIPFAYNASQLSEDAEAALDTFANVLIEENDDVYIEIQGHTDNIGPDAYNLELGRERADAVMAYLHTAHNIPLHRMSTFSYGKSMPAASNDTPEDRAKNRRVVLVVME